MPKGRKSVEVNVSLLESCIREVEKNGSVDGGMVRRNELVAEMYNQNPQIDEKITHSVVGLRIKSLGIKTVTKAGKRGATKGQGFPGRNTGVRISKAEKFEKNATISNHHAKLEKNTPERFLPIVEQIKSGSRSAAVKLHCLECSGYVTTEVRNCACEGNCPLWAFRPYQGKIEADEEQEQEEEQDDFDMDQAEAA